MSANTIAILNYEVACLTLLETVDWCLAAIKDPKPKLLITLNPEIVARAEKSANTKQAILQADLIVPDGVGILWAAKCLGQKLPERVPGIELMLQILEAGGKDLKVYFLGAKAPVVEKAATNAKKYYRTEVVGVQHGYFKDPEELPTIINNIRNSGAHLLLAGLGEKQELFLNQNKQKLNIPLMMGVGGSLDVLSGYVKRAPLWTRKLGIEWVYRIGLDIKRWHRFPRLLKFALLVWKNRNHKNQQS